ncbi:PAS domain S-box protein [Paucidesulfovibrio longus]|uniref:PAS domain S-box protein n=1 Tax=Paucidesulfovibrio longus TaxID=889 RepID=UPI00041DAE25|nr:PAS domain S-box protein [Paucidesulfovibrio longus]
MESDRTKSKSQLISELEALRARVRELEGPSKQVLREDNHLDAKGNSARYLGSLSERSSEQDLIKPLDWEYQHKERIKELQGIIGLGQLIDKDYDPDVFFRKFVTDIAPPSMQYPDHVIAAVSINDKFYSNSDHSASVSLSASIDLGSSKKGFVKVGYDKDLPFIPEFEQRLVNTYGDIIGRYLIRIETLKKLEESEKRYKALYDSVLGPILVAELDTGIIIECNNAAEELFGRSRTELIGLHQSALHSLDDMTQEGVTRHFKKHLENQELTQEIRSLRPDGSFRVAEVKAKRFSLQGKDLILGVFHDTTEAKKSEQDLRRSEEHYRLLTENVRDIIWQRDASLNVTYMSPSVETVLGFTPEEAIAASPQQRFTPASLKLLAELREELQDIFAKGQAGAAQRRLELEALHKDGHSVWLEIDARSVTDEEGRFLYLMGVSRDITERKRAEAALRESERRVRRKLKAILHPEEGMADLELSDIIDSEALQSMMDNFYQVTGIGIGVLDMKGNVLVATGWQDICTRFHREHPDTAKSCRRSDLQLSSGVLPGEFRLYRCKNNMWDIATPLIVGGNHLGNIFLGQFFFEDEEPDREVFRRQAQLYGFDEKEYLEALDRVPRWSRERVHTVMRFYSQFADTLASLSYGNIKLAWAKTEKDRLYEELRKSQERLALAVEGTQVGLWDWRVQSGEVYFNEQWAIIAGYTLKELEPLSIQIWMNLCHPEDLERSEKSLQDHFQGKTQIYQCEARMRHKDGHWIWVLDQGKVVEWDEQGAPIRMAGTHQDITERKLSEHALRESEERFKALHNASFGGITIHDKGLILDCNQGLCDISGFFMEELIGMDGLLLIAREAREMVMANILAGYEEPYEAIGVRKNGDKYPLRLQAKNIPYKGKQVRVVEFRDITEQKEVEVALIEAKDKAEDASRVKSEFLANMSHEIRTPMNGVLGMLQLMQTISMNEEQKEYILTAIQSSKRLTRLLSDILDLSRVEANRLTIQSQPMDLVELLKQTCELFKPTAQQTHIDHFCYVDPVIPSVVKGDAPRLQQVLTNLIGNAFKFTKEGHISVEAYPLATSDSNQVRVLFSVTDTGIGIADEKIKQLFQPFSQVSTGYRRDYQGAGLGLSICKKLIELMGGTIAIESELGKGTTVYFCVTFSVDESRLSQEISASRVRKSKQCRILLAEDEDVNRLATSKLLERKGHIVKAVKDGQEAIALLKEDTFDVILMDIQMPIMDGVEATKAIRGGDAGQGRKDIPIIAMTAYAMSGDKEKFLAAGMNDYTAKPVDVEHIESLILRLT